MRNVPVGLWAKETQGGGEDDQQWRMEVTQTVRASPRCIPQKHVPAREMSRLRASHAHLLDLVVCRVLGDAQDLVVVLACSLLHLQLCLSQQARRICSGQDVSFHTQGETPDDWGARNGTEGTRCSLAQHPRNSHTRTQAAPTKSKSTHTLHLRLLRPRLSEARTRGERVSQETVSCIRNPHQTPQPPDETGPTNAPLFAGSSLCACS